MTDKPTTRALAHYRAPASFQAIRANTETLSTALEARPLNGKEWRVAVQYYNKVPGLVSPAESIHEIRRATSSAAHGLLRLPRQTLEFITRVNQIGEFADAPEQQARLRALVLNAGQINLKACFANQASAPKTSSGLAVLQYLTPTQNAQHLFMIAGGYLDTTPGDTYKPGNVAEPEKRQEISASSKDLMYNPKTLSTIAYAEKIYTPIKPVYTAISTVAKLDTAELEHKRIADAAHSFDMIDHEIRRSAESTTRAAGHIIRQAASLNRRTSRHLVDFFDLAIADAAGLLNISRALVDTEPLIRVNQQSLAHFPRQSFR